MVLPIYATLERLDPALVEAAADLGARPLHDAVPRDRAARAARAFVAGSVLVFIPCLGAYLTPDLLGGGRTVLVGNLVQNQFTTARDWPFGSAVSLALMALVTLLLVLFLRRESEAVWYEARGSALYAVGVLRFLHVPLLTLAVFSFNSSRFTVWEALFAATGTAPSFAIRRSSKARGTASSSRSVATVLSTVIGTLCAYGLWKRGSRDSDGRAVSLAGDAGDRDRRFAAGAVPVGLPLSALAARACTR